MESFQSCADQGVQAIELDIHLCATGELVVTHDFNVKRVSGYDGLVEQMSFNQLRALDAGFYKKTGI
jgi:glycerophosphoryl diester phosphodiesterase